MKLSVVKGATSVLVRIFIQDSSSLVGAGLTGLVFNTSGLTCCRMRDDDGNAGATSITLATATLGTWASGGFKEKDATNAPGWYEFGIPNAALATGSRSVDFHFKGATNMAPCPIEIELTGWDNQDAVRGGMTALPNVASGSAGAIPTTGTGANQIQVNGTGGVSHVVLTDTLTTYTGNTVQTGDSYARLGAPAGATIAADLVEIEAETDGIAAIPTTPVTTAHFDSVIGTPAGASVSVDVAAVKTDTGNLASRLTSARAGYLDNLNVGGNVASHADFLAINQSASKHLLLVTVGQYEPGETYTVEMRTFTAADGSAVNADTTPTLTATGNVSGSLAANLSAATNPATGVYRWTYTPGATPTLEQIRFDGSATISSAAFTLSAYSQTVDEATAVFTATDQGHLTSIFNKLPTNNIADETLVLAAIGTPQQAGSAVTLPSDFTPTMKTSIGTAVAASAVASVTAPVTLTSAYDAAKTAAQAGNAMTLANGAITTASIADGAITDAKITVPAEAAGRPTGILAMMRRGWEWLTNERDRDRSTGVVTLKNAAGNGTLETQTQSSSGTVDTISKGA